MARTVYKFKKGARVRASRPKRILPANEGPVTMEALVVIGTVTERMPPYKVWFSPTVGEGVNGDVPVYRVVWEKGRQGRWCSDFTEDQLEAWPPPK